MIRRMRQDDIGAVAELEQECFHVPWSANLLKEGLESPLDRYFVLEEGNGIAGYCALRVIAGEGEIQRIAVKPQMRRCGYGKKLMDAMVMDARKNQVSDLILEVRAGNENAINLYRSYGFRKEGIRRGYYTEPAEDAWLMRLTGISSNSQ